MIKPRVPTIARRMMQAVTAPVPLSRRNGVLDELNVPPWGSRVPAACADVGVIIQE